MNKKNKRIAAYQKMSNASKIYIAAYSKRLSKLIRSFEPVNLSRPEDDLTSPHN